MNWSLGDSFRETKDGHLYFIVAVSIARYPNSASKELILKILEGAEVSRTLRPKQRKLMSKQLLKLT